MDQIAFQTPFPERVTQAAVDRAYMVGYGGTPIPSFTKPDGGGRFVLQRSVEESGYLQIPWVVDDLGELVLSTTSLMAQREPYWLELELARGTLNRLRNHIAVGNLANLEIPETTRSLVRASVQCKIKAVEYPEIYQKFFKSLGQSLFLSAQME